LIFQIGAPLLDACVLSVVGREDTYGYALTQTLKGLLGVSESTLYPVLRRLQKDNCLSTYDMPYGGRNRRYYRITDAGSRMATMYSEVWRDYRGRIDELILGGEQIG
jgi:PadR family transcriptional regulator PadR